jgi:hypothetical protein
LEELSDKQADYIGVEKQGPLTGLLSLLDQIADFRGLHGFLFQKEPGHMPGSFVSWGDS